MASIEQLQIQPALPKFETNDLHVSYTHYSADLVGKLF